MGFRPVPVPADATVEMTVDLFPALNVVRKSQRLGLTLNGTDLGHWNLSKDEPLRVLIPAALWNGRPRAFLRWDFPDAISPLALHDSLDPREIAFGFRRITFRVVPPRG